MAAQDDSGDVLSLDGTHKSHELEDVDALFRDMRRAIEENGERTPDEIAVGFAAAAASLGTHGPKLANPRSPDKPFTPEITEPEFRKHYSGDGKYGRFAKALLRPIAIVDQVGNGNFAERLEARSNSTAIMGTTKIPGSGCCRHCGAPPVMHLLLTAYEDVRLSASVHRKLIRSRRP